MMLDAHDKAASWRSQVETLVEALEHLRCNYPMNDNMVRIIEDALAKSKE
jgi:hypothetical protein